MKLFNEKLPAEFLNEVKNEIAYTLDAIDVSHIDIPERSEKMARQFMIKFPIIDKKNIFVKADIEDRNGKSYPEDLSGRINPCDAIFTATYTVPFQGDARVFSLGSIYSPQYESVNIEDGKLYFKIRIPYVSLKLPDDKKKQVKEGALDYVKWIENNLNNLQQNIKDFNDGLMPEIQKFLENKKAELEEKSKMEKDINPFI
jgi:hypothetical protein